MKVCLINSPYLITYGSFNVGHNCYFPLGLGYIASLLSKEGHEVLLLDPDAQRLDLNKLKEKILYFKPDVVGISTLTPSFPNALRIARIIKENIAAPIIIGGVHATALSKEILKQYNEFDIVVRGEGEFTFLELCQYFQGNKKLELIKGITYRNGNTGIIENEPRPYLENLDILPFPARNLVNMDNYQLNVHFDRGIRSATMITSRGCPSQCTYCASFLIAGKKFRAHSSQYTINEIEKLIKDYGVRHILFWDDSFTLTHERVIEICNLILKKKLNFTWTCMGRVDRGNKQIYSLMKKSGCYNILFGIESGNEEILKNIKKNITLDEARATLKICNDLGIKTHLTFIFGSPGETAKTIRNSINFAKELKPTLANFFMVIPYVGTEIYNKLYSSNHKKDEIANWEDWTHSSINAPVRYLETEVSTTEIKKWLFRAYWKFYLNPFQILRILKFIDSFEVLKIYLRGGLGLLCQSLLWRLKNQKIKAS